MAKTNTENTATPITNTPTDGVNLAKSSNTARVVLGVGNDPIIVDVKPGDTVLDLIKRAGGVIHSKDAVAIGKKAIANPGKTPAEPNTTIVVTGKLSNG